MYIPENGKNTTFQESTSWVQQVLPPEQLSTVRRAKRFGRQKLKPGTLIILWALRVYVVVMFFLVIYQIWMALHS
jgi:hypothetical protein